MIRSETYNIRNDILCAQNQHLAESVILFRILTPKSGKNPC